VGHYGYFHVCGFPKHANEASKEDAVSVDAEERKLAHELDPMRKRDTAAVVSLSMLALVVQEFLELLLEQGDLGDEEIVNRMRELHRRTEQARHII
jgi:hypothetical protein